MTDITLLVADDEAIARAFIRKMLEDEKAPVATIYEAANGLEAVELARLHKPDLVLLDIRMPLQDGLEAALRIKEECPETHIVIVTAHDDFDYARTALRAGVAEYLLKPVRPEDITPLVYAVSAKAMRAALQKPRELPENLPLQVKAAVTHVLENLEASLDLHSIAAAVFVSPFHLSRLFTKHMGKPLSDFILDERLAQAKNLLARTPQPISLVAEQCGFSTLAYFSACFKKNLGLAPSEYRKMISARRKT